MSTLGLILAGYAIILPPLGVLVGLALRERRRSDSRRIDP